MDRLEELRQYSISSKHPTVWFGPEEAEIYSEQVLASGGFVPMKVSIRASSLLGSAQSIGTEVTLEVTDTASLLCEVVLGS